MNQPPQPFFQKATKFVSSYKVIIFMVCCVLFFGTVFVSAFTAEPMKTYRNKQAGYELSVPTEAKVSPTDLGQTIAFDTHASVTVLKIPGFGIAEEKLFEQSTKDLIRENYLHAYNLKDDAFFKAEVARRKALGVSYADTSSQPPLRMKQYYVVQGDALYVLTESTPGKFRTLDRMIGSFTFL